MALDFKYYQQQSRTTAVYPNKGNNFTYTTLGLCGESGEIAEKVKKIIRDKGGEIDGETKDALEKELGDILWYLSNTASEFGLDLENVAQRNLDKLFNRQQRGKLHGSGDDR